MAKYKYLTAPPPSEKMPKAIPYILTNEAAERFSFYGMRAILITFMTAHLMALDGTAAPMTDETAKFWMHLFVAVSYAMPIIGALMADIWLAKYRTIIWFSVLYCFGFVAFVLDNTRIGLFAALALIALGAGIIKACVSANVGDQFGKKNQHLMSGVFGWFYFAINLGAFLSMFGTPILLSKYGPRSAFVLCLVLMVVATIAFWMGRKKFIHVPAGGMGFVKESFGSEGLSALRRLLPVFLFIAVFWSLFDQTMGAWILQAENMNLQFFSDDFVAGLPSWLGFLGMEMLPQQLTSVNSLMILIMIPMFTYIIYPAINKVFTMTPLRKISIGMFVAFFSFAVSAFIEKWIVAGQTPSGWWQILAYLLITAAEIMISITCLEFSYTQAPKKMKSFIMSYFLLSISLGNVLTAIVNKYIENADGTTKLPGPSYYWFFAWMMMAAAVGFIFVAMRYREKTYIMDDAAPEESAG